MSKKYIGPYMSFKVKVTTKVREKNGCKTCNKESPFPYCPYCGNKNEVVLVETKDVDHHWQGCLNDFVKYATSKGHPYQNAEVVNFYTAGDGENNQCIPFCSEFWVKDHISRGYDPTVDRQSANIAEEMRLFKAIFSPYIAQLTTFYGVPPEFHWGLVGKE